MKTKSCFKCNNCLTCQKKKIAGVLAFSLMLIKRRRNKKCGVKNWILKSRNKSIWEKTCQSWIRDDDDMFRRWLRVTPSEFDIILQKVAPKIIKESTNFKNTIPSDKRLAITLAYMSTGATFLDLSVKFCVGLSTVSTILAETLEALVQVLKPDYLKFPSTPSEWLVSDFSYLYVM